MDYSFEEICKSVGALFLESRHNIQLLNNQLNELRTRLAAAEKERDDALKLLVQKGQS